MKEAENGECIDFLSGLALITGSYSPEVLLSVSEENLVCPYLESSIVTIRSSLL